MKDGRLFLHGKPVIYVDITEALNSFKDWLSSFGKSVILVGHNIKSFDLKHLFRHSDLHGINFPFVAGFIDTLLLFRTLFCGQKSYSQEQLYRQFVCSDGYHAHNSLDDVIALSNLLKAAISDVSSLQPHSFSEAWFKAYTNYMQVKIQNIKTFNPLFASKEMSKSMIENRVSEAMRIGNKICTNR